MRKVALPLFVMALSQFGFAGSVITSGLKNCAAIINVDATSDGAAQSSDSFAKWYAPFAANGNLTEYTFAPGTYTFTVVNPTDATTAFVDPNDSRISSLYTAWTYNSPYLTDWMAFKTSALTDSNESQLLSGAVTDGYYYNPTDAYNAGVSGGFLDTVKVGDRVNGLAQKSYTFAATTTLIFDIPDQGVYDNGGGVSILVQPAPEPNMALLLVPFGLLVAAKRRR